MNERLTIQDLTDLLAAKHSMTKKDAEAFVKEFFLLIEQSLQNENIVKIKGLGTFKLIDVDSRESVNVNTGERFQIKGHTKVSFTPDTGLRDTINKPFAHFETVVLNENTILEDTPLEEEEEETGEHLPEQTVSKSENDTEEEENITEDNLIPEVAETSVIEETIAEESIVEPESIPVIQEAAIQQQQTTSEPAQESEEITAEKIIAQELIKANLKPEVPIAKVEKVKPAQSIPASAPSKKEVSQKEKSPVPYLVAIIVIVLLLCGGVILFIYYPDIFSSSANKDTIDMPVVTQPVQPEKQFADTIVQKDSVNKVTPAIPKEEVIGTQSVVKEKEIVAPVKTETPVVQKQPTSVYTDSATYKITGTKTSHTIKEGETLTKVSLRFYGTKAMWPYIVKHNPGVIKNPDNVPYGTTIKIPELSKE